LVGTIIVDEDGIYDPRHPNDRLLLGMKGTMSELELSLLRQRSQEALRQKARRGALVLGVAAGYVKVGRDRIGAGFSDAVAVTVPHTPSRWRPRSAQARNRGWGGSDGEAGSMGI